MEDAPTITVQTWVQMVMVVPMVKPMGLLLEVVDSIPMENLRLKEVAMKMVVVKPS